MVGEGPSIPVFDGPEGILFDFNYGCRVQVPVSGWRVKMVDADTFNVLLNEHVEANVVIASVRKYYVRFLLEVFDGPRLVFSHSFNPTGRKIRLRMPAWALGDSIAWMPVIEAFREQHECEVHVPMGEHLQPLYRDGYPRLHLATEAQLTERDDTYYATYYFGWIVPFFDRDHQPTDPRISSMQDAVAYQLGVPPGEYKPTLVLSDTARLIADRYVCIATQSTQQRKYWNNPDGWPILIDHLKSLGYRVLCIDRYWQYGNDEFTNTMPEGAENFTGDRSLRDRAKMLLHADFFIGLGSGLSWLAWALGVPVVMINGFTHPSTEFYTPYRVINFHVCNSCLNDTSIEFAPDTFERCPRFENSPKQFQCSAAITPRFVMRVVDQLISDRRLLCSE
jgi:autotransporter strand-loop-strand O-heptosyltransferase